MFTPELHHHLRDCHSFDSPRAARALHPPKGDRPRRALLLLTRTAPRRLHAPSTSQPRRTPTTPTSAGGSTQVHSQPATMALLLAPLRATYGAALDLWGDAPRPDAEESVVGAATPYFAAAVGVEIAASWATGRKVRSFSGVGPSGRSVWHDERTALPQARSSVIPPHRSSPTTLLTLMTRR